MDHIKSSLDLVRLLLDYQGKLNFFLDDQGKLNSFLDDFKNSFHELTTNCLKLEAYLNRSRNVNSKLTDSLINVERKRFANK